MVDLGALTAADFVPLVGDGFAVGGADPVVELRLAEVDESSRGSAGRLAFSLLFTGPAEVLLAQGTWPLRHEGLGELAIFLVPIGHRDDVPAYEAVFA